MGIKRHRDASYARWVIFYAVVFFSQAFLISHHVRHGLFDGAMHHQDDSDQSIVVPPEKTTPEKPRRSEHTSARPFEKLFLTDSGTPYVPDVCTEVDEYYETILGSMKSSIEMISQNQIRTTVGDLKLDKGVHATGTSRLLEKRLEFIQRLHHMMSPKRERELVCIATTVQHDAASVESKILPWIQYHVEMGIDRFYILYDGEDLKAVQVLTHIHLKDIVTVLLVKGHLGASEEMQTKFKFYDKLHEQHAEGNKGLMKKQRFAVNEAIAQARLDGQSWVIQMDVDELFLPTGHDSIPAVFNAIPSDVPAVRFMNFESQAEAGDITSPFLQSNLFRVHMYFTTPEAQYYRGKFKQGMNAGFLYLYANGKSAARISDLWTVSQFGPHYFKGDKDNWMNPISNDSFILHYCYVNPSELIQKAERSCPKHFGTSVSFEKVKEDCFILDADARAFMAANAGKEEAETFFYENFVYSEGAPVNCVNEESGREGWCPLSDIATLKELLVRIGLLKRFTLPQVILKRHEIEMSMLEAGTIDHP